jgi:alkylhydroperoxidase family enzyme
MSEPISRIPPLDAPYAPEVERQLARMMPPGSDPIALFRTFAVNLPMTVAMSEWGAYELGRSLSLTMRQRELVIDRTCARCGCEYEWGVHIAFFGDRVGLTSEQIRSLTAGSPSDPCWVDPDESALLEAVDQLHDASSISDPLWERLSVAYQPDQLLDLTMLCGWYHAISFSAVVARVDCEPFAPRFADFRHQ